MRNLFSSFAGRRLHPLAILLAALLGAGLGRAGAATNDTFAFATPISLGQTNLATNDTGYTKEALEPAPSAGSGGFSAWWVWTAPVGFNGAVAVSTKGSDFDTVLDVWTGAAVSALTRITFSDDYAYGDPISTSGGAPRTSMCTFTATGNTTYHFRVDGYSGIGNIRLSLQQVPTATIAMSTPNQEGSANPGVWTVSFNSSLVDTVPVSWSITGGTAPNLHYTLSTANPLLMGANSVSGFINMTTTDDGLATGNLTVIDTLSGASFGNYVIGSPSSAAMIIVDAESPFVYVNQAATGANTGQTWANAFVDLHAAMANAVSGNQVWVAQGTYSTTAVSDTFMLATGVTMFGGFQGNETQLAQRNRFGNLTTLNGAFSGGNCNHVVYAGDGSTIDGFVITGGNATGAVDYPYGGGLFCIGAPTVRRCTFIGNKAVTLGGAVFIDSFSAAPTLTDCYFVNNSVTDSGSIYGGGGAFILAGGTTITNCVFANNSTASLAANTTGGCGGGGLLLFDSPGATLMNCTFYGNTAPAVGGAGGAIFNIGSTFTATNCIFSGNTAGGAFSGVANSTSSASTSTSGSSMYQEAAEFTNFGGTGNFLGFNPGFSNTAQLAGADGIYGNADDGLALTAGSPALDIGIASGAPGDDISNHGRPLGGGIDMGAYELGTTIFVTAGGNPAANGSSWFNATTLAHALQMALNGNTIWVAAGIHSPTLPAGNASTFQMVVGVDIYGGFNGTETLLSQRNPALNPTILSGTLNSSYHVVTGASNARLDGFVITQGKAVGATGFDNDGGGLLCIGATTTVAGCVFSQDSSANAGGAVYIHNACSPNFRNCVFTGNSTANFGGAVHMDGGATPAFVNCTFSGNTSTNALGGAIATVGGSNFTMVNSILWGDIGAEIFNSGSTPGISFSDIQGGLPGGSADGGGNFNLDPRFTNTGSPAGADGHFMDGDDGLMPGGTSPCLDAGNLIAATTQDIIHTLRPQGPGVDLGAYEVPYVSVVATNPNASKPALSGAPTNGLFTLTRTGVLSQPLTVYVSVTGTAVAGSDYTTITSPLTFAANSATLAVPVGVIASSMAGSTVSVVLTVLPSVPGNANGYAVVTTPSPLNSATVSIANLNTPGVVIIPTGPFTTPSPSNVLFTQPLPLPSTTATFTVQLNSQPANSVTVFLASSNPLEGSLSTPSVTFTTGNWNSPQTVTVTGVADYIAHGPQSYLVQSSGAVSQDPLYSRNTTTVLAGQQSVFNTQMPFVAQSGNNWLVKVNTAFRSPASFAVSSTGGLATIALTTPFPGAGDTVEIEYLGEETIPTVSGHLLYPTTFPLVLAKPNSWVVSLVNNGTGAVTVKAPGTDYTIIADGANPALADISFTSPPPTTVSVFVQTDVVAAVNGNTNVHSVSISPGTVNVTEGGATANYTVVLTSQPSSGNVVVNLAPSLGNLFTNVPSVTFTPVLGQTVSGTTSGWNVPQTITVSATRDFNVQGGVYHGTIAETVSAGATCDYTTGGVTAPTVQVNITDVDSIGVVLHPTSGIVTSEAGTQATFTVALNSRPSVATTISLVCSDDTTTHGSPAAPNGGAFLVNSVQQATTQVITLTFTPSDGQAITGGSTTAQTGGWNVAQTVTLQGLRGIIGNVGNTTYFVNYAGAISGDAGYAALSTAGHVETCTNSDSDIPGILVTPNQVSVVRGDTVGQTFSVQLATLPSSVVAVSFADTLSGLATCTPSTVIFTPGNATIPVTVRITAGDDGVVEAQVQNDTMNYSATSSDGSYQGTTGSIAVTVLDDGVAGISITPTAGLVTTESGGTASFDVGLLSRPAASGTVNVTLTSSNLGAGILAQEYFSSATAGAAPGTSLVTLASGADVSALLAQNPSMLVKIAGLGPNSGAVTQIVATAPGTITVSPALTAYNGAETVYLLPSTSILQGSTAGGSPVISFAGSPDLSAVFEGQSVLLSGLPAGATFTSTVRAVDRINSLVTLTGSIPAGSSETVWFSAGPLVLDWAAASWQVAQQVTVIGMHNLQVNGNVNYQVTASATSSDPHYVTTQSVAVVGSTSVIATQIPYKAFDGSNWTVRQVATPLSGFTIVDNAGYAQVNLAAAVSSTTITVTYLPIVSLTNIDIDSAGFTVTPPTNAIIFPSPATPSSSQFTIALTSEPAGDVSVQVQSSNTAKGVIASATPLVFTQATPNGGLGWDQPHTVAVTAVGSAVADGAVSYTISPLPATSSDPNYSTLVANRVTLTTVDPNSAGIVVTSPVGAQDPATTPLVTNAQSGTTATFSAVLTSQPLSAVSIPISSSTPGRGTASTPSLLFTPANWNVAQPVTVTGVDNPIVQGTVLYQINFGQPQTSDPGYAVLNTAPVQVYGKDNNVAGYIISDPNSQSGHVFRFSGGPPTDPALLTTDLGGTARFQVALSSQPQGGDTVTINLASSDTTLGTPLPASLTFNANNWNVPQPVTVTGGSAGNSDADGSYTIFSSSVVSTAPYNGLLLAPVPLLNVAQNKTPTLDPIANVSINENDSTSPPITLTGISTGQAAEIKVLSVTAVSDNPALIPNASPNLVVTYAATTPAPATGTLAFQPALDQFGVANVTVTVTSVDTTAPPPPYAAPAQWRGGTKSVSQTFSITVAHVNQAPSFVPSVAPIVVLEGSPPQLVAAWASSILVGPANENSQHASFTTVNDNNALFLVQPAVDPITGNLSYTLVPTAFGVANVRVGLHDDGGTANGGVDSTAPVAFTITVTPVNHAPTFTEGASISIPEGAGPQTFASWATGISSGPADEASQTLAFSCSNDNNALFSVQPALDLAGNLTFTPLPTTKGFTTVTVTLQDNGGTANGGVDTTVQTFTITINPGNAAPVVTISPAAGRPVSIGANVVIAPTDLFATDVDSTVPFPAHDPGLVFTLQLVPGNGTVQRNGVALAVGDTFTQQDIISGLVSYTHNGGTSSSDGFAFIVSDNPIPAGSVLAVPPLPATTLPPGVSPLQVFTIVIDRSNPVVTLLPAGPLAFLDQGAPELIAPLATVSDPLAPAPEFQGGSITASFASGGTSSDVIAVDVSGSFSLSGSNLFYDPGTGPLQFGTLTSSQNASGTLLTVTNLGASADLAAVQAFIRSLTYQNTAISPSDPYATPLTTRVVQVVVKDTHNDSSQPAQLTIAVTSVPHAPAFTSPAQYITAENVPLSGQVVALDADGQVLTYSLVGIPSLGTVVINSATGAFTFTPVANTTGTGGFSVQVSDGQSETVTQAIIVDITADNALEPFITSNPPMDTQQNDTVIYNVVGYSPGTATPTFTVIGLAAGAYTISVSGQTATLTLLPAATASAGYVTFGILITDPTNSLSGFQPVTLLVEPTPAAGG